jgi:hypothetical protein
VALILGDGEVKLRRRQNCSQSSSLFQGVMSRVYMGCGDVVEGIVGFCFIFFICAWLERVGQVERWVVTHSDLHLSILSVG